MFTRKRKSVVQWITVLVLFVVIGMGQVVVAQAKTATDIELFQEFLRQEQKMYDETFQIVDVPLYKRLKWDINDTSTWQGVKIQNGRITEIDFPLVSIGGTLDLTGFDKLEKLECIYTDFDGLILKGCTSLKELIFIENNITTLDLSDCDMLEEVDVGDNKLRSIIWGDLNNLKSLKCTNNYLDTELDPQMTAAIQAVKDKGFNPLCESQYVDLQAPYCQKDVAVIQKFLSHKNNASVLGWDKNSIATWEGVTWKTIGGVNYVRNLDVATKAVTGSVKVSNLKYLLGLSCGGTKLTSLDISGCKKLESLSCSNSKLKVLKFGKNTALTYLDCRYNYLIVEDIEKECKKIAKRAGSDSVYYEKQYARKIVVPKVKLTKCKAKKNKITFTFKKNKNVSGYEVRFRKEYTRNGKIVKTKSWKKNKITLRNLKPKTTYYFNVCGYKVANGKKYYSYVSSTKAVKTK